MHLVSFAVNLWFFLNDEPVCESASAVARMAAEQLYIPSESNQTGSIGEFSFHSRGDLAIFRFG